MDVSAQKLVLRHRSLDGFTERQGQYIAFVHAYTKLNRRPPAESDMQAFFSVSAPAVHPMVKTLDPAGLIFRESGRPRSVEVLVNPSELPPLE